MLALISFFPSNSLFLWLMVVLHSYIQELYHMRMVSLCDNGRNKSRLFVIMNGEVLNIKSLDCFKKLHGIFKWSRDH